MAKSYVKLFNPETRDNIVLVARNQQIDINEYSGYTEIVNVSSEPPTNQDSISILKQISSDRILHLSQFDSNATGSSITGNLKKRR